MQSRATTLCVAIVLSGPSVPASSAGETAAQAMNQVRQALSPTGQIEDVQQLLVSGEARFQDGTRVERRLSLAYPDRLEEEELVHFGGGGPTVGRISELTPDGASLRPGAGGVPLAISLDEKGRKELADDLRRRLLLSGVTFLAGGPRSLGLAARYVGRAEASDGQAHVLEFSAEGPFVAQLFVDVATKRPLMVRYQGHPRRSTSTEGKGRGPSSHRPLVETIDVRLEDFKAVGGILVPHRLITSVGQDVIEEWEIARATIGR